MIPSDKEIRALKNQVRREREEQCKKERIDRLDRFAEKALIGYATDSVALSSERVAELCYDLAEAMLKERERRMK